MSCNHVNLFYYIQEVNKDVAGRCWAIVIGETNGMKDDSTMDQILPAFVINYT